MPTIDRLIDFIWEGIECYCERWYNGGAMGEYMRRLSPLFPRIGGYTRPKTDIIQVDLQANIIADKSVRIL